MSNLNIITTKTQAPVWMVDYSGELVNESRTGKRDSSGKFLTQHVKLTQPAKRHSAANLDLAAKFDADPDELFAGGR